MSLTEIIYHYTSQNGLLSIIKSKTIWMTSILYLNDAQEFSYGISLLKKEINFFKSRLNPFGRIKDHDVPKYKFLNALDKMIPQLGTIADSIFVFSFSEKKDLLSQWRGYCPEGGGFSIGFKKSELKKIIMKEKMLLDKCTYDLTKPKQEIKDLLDKVLLDLTPSTDEEELKLSFFGKFIEDIAPIIKNKAYSEECEWRIVSPLLTNSPSNPKIDFREGKSMLIPYLKMKLTDDRGKIPISEIVVGPTPHMDLAQASLNLLLEQEGLDIDVIPSKIPYRNW